MYSFGLVMAGISSRAAGSLTNHKKFVGQEFDEDLAVNLYQFKWRNHDPQIGRFIQIDPLASEYEYNSTYPYAENRPIDGIDLEGLEFWRSVTVLADKLWTNDVKPAMDWVNENVNPVTPFAELITGKAYNNGSFDIDKPRSQSATEAAITLIPGAKIEGAVLKTAENALIKEEVKQVEKTVVKTSTGTEITGFKKHAVNRAIEREVKTPAIKDAIKNPLKTGDVITDKLGRQSQRYVGKTAEVVVNPETGKIISVNPTSTKKAQKLIKKASE